MRCFKFNFKQQQQRKLPCYNQVCYLFSLPPINHYQFFTTSLESTPKFKNPQFNSTPSTKLSGIANSVTLRCSHLWDNKNEPISHLSFKHLLLNLSYISPQITRRFFRFSELQPQHVLEILLGFKNDDRKIEDKVKKIESLWGIFKWASNQSRDFRHVSESCKIMASMLVEVEKFGDAEFLLDKDESRGILLGCGEIFSRLVIGYVDSNELKRGISVYDRMRGLGLVPFLHCYHVLLNNLVQLSETRLAFPLFVDMVQNHVEINLEGKRIYQRVVQVLCIQGKVQEARNFVKKVANVGLIPNKSVLNAIACAYCEKKDYDDVLTFFAETGCAPNVICGNKIISSLCESFGTEEAFLFMQELEFLGFVPDEITFGILIAWACHQSKLKEAFIYLSDILSRGLKPHIYSYNALMSGIFKEGLWKHAKDILNEMDDRGITPEVSTYRVLLAGLCRVRQYEEVRSVVREMENCGLLKSSPLEDLLSKAHLLLGFDPSSVKVRRDNDVGFSRTEFFDNTGNGLYLDTDDDKFEIITTQVLDESMIPDVNTLVLKELCHKNLKQALLLVNDLLRWGQDLSLCAYSTILKEICASRCGIRPITNLLERFPKLSRQLDQETLNVLVQAHIKRDNLSTASIIFDAMVQRRLRIANETYTVVVKGLCKVRDSGCIRNCWELARSDKWLPDFEDYKVLIPLLSQKKMLKEALDLFETMMVSCPHIQLDVCHSFLECFCGTGFTLTAHALAEELLKREFVLGGVAYSLLIQGFCREKRISRACTVYDNLLATNISLDFDALVLLIPELRRTGNCQKISFLKESILKGQPLLGLSICDSMKGFCMAGMVGEAANLLQYMLLKGIRPHDEVYNMLFQGYCHYKNYREVAELLGFMIKKSITTSSQSYRRFVSLMCMGGRIASALSMKEFMLQGNKSSHELIYNILIFYLFFSGNGNIVNSVLEEMQERGLQLNETTYNFVISGLSCCTDVSCALHYLNIMMSKEIIPSNRCFRAVIKCLCRCWELDKALDLSRKMEALGRFHDSTIQNHIVEGLLTDGKLQEAVSFLDRMENQGLTPKNIVYDNIIKLLSCKGRQDKAVHLLDIMLRNGNIPCSSTYDCLIHSYVMCYKLNESLDLCSEMSHRNLYPSTKTWSALIQNVCEDGKPAEAETLLHSMVNMGEVPIREMYCTVIDRYCFENNFSKASELLGSMKQHGYEPEFETQWSLIRHLSSSTHKDKSKSSPPFLSRLLSESGFVRKGDPKPKI